MTPQYSIWVTSLQQWMDGEPYTIKKVCCEAALTPRTIVTPEQYLGYLPQDWIGWGAGGLFYKRLSSAHLLEQSLTCDLVCSKVGIGVKSFK